LGIFENAEDAVIEAIDVDNGIEFAAECEDVIESEELLGLFVAGECESDDAKRASGEFGVLAEELCEGGFGFPGESPCDGAAGDGDDELVWGFVCDGVLVIAEAECVGAC
jgi:hypothetical protein